MTQVVTSTGAPGELNATLPDGPASMGKYPRDALDSLGAAGWELVSVTHSSVQFGQDFGSNYGYFLKRPLD